MESFMSDATNWSRLSMTLINADDNWHLRLINFSTLFQTMFQSYISSSCNAQTRINDLN